MTDPWGLKPRPEGGYESRNGRLLVHKKGKRWLVTLDGRDHDIPSRKPSFDHVEFILQRELGKRAGAYDYDRRPAPH
jgi:hypothetical protein